MDELVKQVSDKLKTINLMHMFLCRMHAEKSGVPRGQFPILKYLSHHSNCSQIELVRHFHFSPAAISKSINRLEKSGLVSKCLDKSEKRSNKIFITQLGKETLENAENYFDEIEELLFKTLDQNELKELLSLLNKITTGIKDKFLDGSSLNEILKF